MIIAGHTYKVCEQIWRNEIPAVRTASYNLVQDDESFVNKIDFNLNQSFFACFDVSTQVSPLFYKTQAKGAL